ncbi:MAG: hypothetical protein OCD01_14775 [Fibrobacterales bacterium]
MNKLALIIFVLITTAQSATVIFKDPYPFYKGADIFTVETKVTGLKAKELCREMARQNTFISRIECRRAGNFERSIPFMTYMKWISKNIYPSIAPKHLAARDDSVRAVLRENEDNYIIYLYQKENTTWATLFHGGYHEPKALISIASIDPRDIYTEIAQTLFMAQQETQLTDEQKRIAKDTPNSFYNERIAYDLYVLYGFGYTAGLFSPPEGGAITTADNAGDPWYVWNWLDRGEPLADVPVLKNIVGRPLHNIQFGVQYAEFIGGSLSLNYSDYSIRYGNDTAAWHHDITDWTFRRYELGINITLSKYFRPLGIMEIAPKLVFGLRYTFWSSDFTRTAPQKSPPFELSTMKGAHIGFATHFLFKEKIGIQFDTGISYRGHKSEDLKSNATDRLTNETFIAAYDYYIQVGIFYLMRTFVD